MTVQTAAGAIIAISAAAPATFNAAGYDTLTFTVIGEVTDFGELGREYNLVTHNPVASRGTVKKKGSFNEGQMTLGLGIDRDDAGQVLARTALDDDADYSFKLTYQDGSIDYFQSVVMSFKTQVGSVDNIVAGTISLELTTSSTGVGIVHKPAA